MNVVQFQTPGGIEVLDLVETPLPAPGAGEVLVRANYIGVGMPDILIRSGGYGFMPPLPAVPGTEMSGTIEAIGAGVTGLETGQRVVVSAREDNPAFAQEASFRPVPGLTGEGVSFAAVGLDNAYLRRAGDSIQVAPAQGTARRSATFLVS